ncbi:MAG: RNA polymerase sigma factor [Pirellulales bacterium]
MDAGRLAELVDAHAAALELFASRWTAAPEDCVQEAFVELARQTSEPENVGAWLFRVVRNRALNVARSDRRRREREQVAARLRPTEANDSLVSALDAATRQELTHHDMRGTT